MIHLKKFFDAAGNEVDEDGNPIDRKVIPDGGRLSVPLMLCDHAPKSDPREVAWLKMCDWLANAHKHAKSLTAEDAHAQQSVPKLSRDDAADGAREWRSYNVDPRVAAWRAYVARLQSGST